MKDKVDANKILNHIKYTRHWLDKADEDYKNKQFGNGGMILGLARAELTTAWEEALQLKTQVLRRMPQKARGMANWKSASVVGLMASGFLIAFMAIKFANPEYMKQNLGQPEPHTVVLTEQVVPVAPTAVKPEVKKNEPGKAVEEKSAAALAAAPATEAKPAVKTARHAAPRRDKAARPRTQKRHAVIARTEPAAPRLEEAPEAAPVVSQPEPQPARVIIRHEPAPKPKLDNIDLYRTANDAIMQ